MEVTLTPNMDPIYIGLGSSEKANPLNSVRPRKKAMTSVYLKFFETAADGKKRRCKFCGQTYSTATATGISHVLFTVTAVAYPSFSNVMCIVSTTDVHDAPQFVVVKPRAGISL